MKHLLIVFSFLLYTSNSFSQNFSLKAMLQSNIQCENTGYINSASQVLKFKLNYYSDDYEFIDGIRMVFPSGMTPNYGGTSNPLTQTNTSSDSALDLSINGQEVVWGHIGACSYHGSFYNDSACFEVSVNIGAITGVQNIICFVYGDLGTIQADTIFLGEAILHDIAVYKSLVSRKSISSTAFQPKGEFSNFGTSNDTVDLICNIYNDQSILVYSDSIKNQFLTSNTDTILEFQNWIPDTGLFKIEFISSLNTDQFAMNDHIESWTFAHPDFNAYYVGKDYDSTYYSFGKFYYADAIYDDSLFNYSNGISELTWYKNDLWGLKCSSYDGPSTIVKIDTSDGAAIMELYLFGLHLDDIATSPKSEKMYGISDTPNGTIFYSLIPELDTLIELKKFPFRVFDIVIKNSGLAYVISYNFNIYEVNLDSLSFIELGYLGFPLANVTTECDLFYDDSTDVVFAQFVDANSSYQCKLGVFDIQNLSFFETQNNSFGEGRYACYSIPRSYNSVSHDLGIVYIENTGCFCDNPDNTITLILANYGDSAESGFQLGYSINNGSFVYELFNDTIYPGQFFPYTFSAIAPLSGLNEIQIQACVILPSDQNIFNDCETNHNYSMVSAIIPYTNNFNSLPETETLSQNTGSFSKSQWEFYTVGNTVNYSGNASIHYSSGVPANDWLISPCIQILPGTYEISFYHEGSNRDDTRLIVAYDDNPYFNDPDSAIIINDHTGFTSLNLEKETYVFQIDTAGMYYFGWYVYNYTSFSGSFEVDSVLIDVFTSTTELENELKVFPNPVTDYARVISNNVEFQNAEYRIISSDGRVVGGGYLNRNGQLIDFSKFPAGLYYISIVDNNRVFSTRIVKM